MSERILTMPPDEFGPWYEHLRNNWDIFGMVDANDMPKVLAELLALRAERDRLLAERDDLAMLVRRFCARYHEAELTQQAWDYLKRHGLQGSVVRADAQQERT